MRCETKFACIPDAVVWDPELSSDAKVLYWALATFTAKNAAECFPKQATIAEKLRWHRTKVCRAAGELKARGYVSSKQRGQGLEYHLGELPVIRPVASGVTDLPSKCAAGAQTKNVLCAAGATEYVQPAQLGSVDTSKRTITNELIPERVVPHSRPRAPGKSKPVPTLAAADRERLIADFSASLGEAVATETIELALAHKAARNYPNPYLYVRKWLRGDVARKESAHGGPTGTPAHHEQAQAPAEPLTGLAAFTPERAAAERARRKAVALEAERAQDGAVGYASAG